MGDETITTPAERHAERRAAAKHERREVLLDAAIGAVRTHGPLVSMDQIAAACGITKPIIYRHFGDRDGLIVAIAERFVLDLAVALREPMRRDAEPVALLTATVDAFFAIIERDHQLYRFLATQLHTEGQVMAAMIAEEISVVLEGHLTDRDLPAGPARTWAYGLVGMAVFTADWWTSASELDPATAPSRAEVVQQLTSLLWQGFDRLGLGEHPAETVDPRTHPDPPSDRSNHPVRNRKPTP